MSLRVLRAAIDTLEVSFSGNVNEEVSARLDIAKESAISGPRPFDADGIELLVQPKAYGFWRWRLVCPDFSFVMSAGEQPGRVTAQVRFSAWGLGNRRLADLWEQAKMTLAAMGDFSEMSVSRCDVCADFQGWTPTASGLAGMVCAASYRATHGTESSVQTFQYGSGDIVLRLYDKTQEIEKSKKHWVRDLWRQSDSYDRALPVWRVEGQLRRKPLSELGLTSLSGVMENPNAILEFALRWAQLRVPGEDATKTRWPEDPIWRHLRSAVFAGQPLRRVSKVSNLMTLERAKASLRGLAATSGAYFETNDYQSALQQLSLAVEADMMRGKIDFAAEVEAKRRRILSNAS